MLPNKHQEIERKSVSTILVGGKICTPDKVFNPEALVIDNKSITLIQNKSEFKVPKDANVLDTSGCWILPGCNPNLFLVKPNALEESTLTGSKVESTEDALNAASSILQTGVKHVIITQGRKGALLSNQAGTWIAVAPSITKRNDIDAGDEFMTGIIYGLSCNLSWPEILR